MRIRGRRGAIHCIAAGVGTHVHGTHPVGHAAVNGLQIPVVKCVLPQHDHQRIDDFLIRNLTMLIQTVGGVLIILATQSHHHMRNTAFKPIVLLFIACLECLEPSNSRLFQTRCLLA